MAFTLVTTQVIIARTAGALFNTEVGYANMASYVTSAGSNVDAFLNTVYTNSVGNTSTTTVATEIVTNLGITGTAATTATNYVVGELNKVAYTARGAVVNNLLSLFSGLTADPTFGSFATAYNTKVSNAVTYATVSGNADSTFGSVSSSTTVANQTFTLTTGADTGSSFTASSGTDTFDASLNSAGNQTLGALDQLTGGTGTDTLLAQIKSSVTPALLSGVENIQVTATADATLNLANSNAEVIVENLGSTAVATVSGLDSTAVTLKVTDVGDYNTTFTFNTSTVSGSADSATLVLNNVNTTTDTRGVTVDGIETLNIQTTGSNSALKDLNAADATKVVLTGDKKLTITDNLASAINTFDASASTGGLDVDFDATAMTVSGGTGNDSFSFEGVGAVTVSGGAGNDTFDFSTAALNFTSADTVAGGDGTDTLTVDKDDVDTVAITTALTKVSGIETLKISDVMAADAITVANVQAGISTVTLNAGGYGTLTLEAGAQAVKLGAALASGTLTIADTGTATTDALTLSNSATTAVDAGGGQAVTVNGFETVNVVSTNTGASTTQTFGVITLTQDSGGTSTLNFSGTNKVTTAGAITANVISASGLTAATSGSTFTQDTAAVSVTSITGSAGNDTLKGDDSTYINGGAGADGITGGSSHDTLLGGDGNDSITAAAGNDSIDGGAGNDTVTFAATADFTANDTVAGGDGTADKLVTTIGAQTALTDTLTNVTGFEKLEISDAQSTGTLNMARYGSSKPSTVVLAAAESGSGTISNLGAASTIEMNASHATYDLTTTYAADSSADALTIKLNAAATTGFGEVTAASLETFTINSTASATPSSVTNTLALDTTSGTGITVTGDAALVLTTTSAAVSIATVDASGMAGGGVNADVHFATVAQTLTGSAYADTLNGGSAADTITGGAHNDSLIGLSGSDSLVAGTGDDTLDGGANNDTMLGGEGNDVFVLGGGTDSMDGGSGTDSISLTASYSDLASHSMSSIETLDMNSIGGTMSIATYTGFTTISEGAMVTFSDAGTATANTGVTKYTLAAGTNSFTASTTAANNSIVGGTGNDTINISSAVITTNDTINGTSGTDYLNITGNTATSATSNLDSVSNIDRITFSNTTTNISIVQADGVAASGVSVTVDASALTTGTLTWDANGEADGKVNIIAGAANDTITGSTGVDTIDGGAGNDVIKVALATDLGTDEIINGSTGTTDTLYLAVTAGNLTSLHASYDNLVGEAGIEQLVVNGSAVTLDEAIDGTALAINSDGAETLVMTFGTLTDTNFSLANLTFAQFDNYDGTTDGTALANGNDYFVIPTGASATTVTGSSLGDSITGGAAADSITGGEGSDTISGGLSADTIVLTETTATTDNVVITGGLTADVVTGFTTGASGDKVQVDISSVETSGAVVSGITFSLDDLVDGTTAIAAGAVTIQEVADQSGGAAAAAAGARTLYVLLTETYANVAAVETGLETGDHELTVHTGVGTSDAFLVLWSDGTDVYLSSMYVATDSGADPTTGDFVGTNLVKLVGNTSISASEFSADNFAFIA